MIVCSYGCGEEAKYFFKTGKGCCKISPNSCEGKRKKDSEKKKGEFKGTPYWCFSGRTLPIIPWNKGKKGIYSDEHRKKISESLKNVSKGIASSPEKEKIRKQKISNSMKKNPLSGGLRVGSGRGRKGWYKGYWCDSSWELAWVIYNIENNIKFRRNDIGFNYQYKGLTKKYYPDFIIDDTYYEIKGRRSFENLDEINKEKISQFDKNLVVLYLNDIKPYLEYVVNKYGKNYIGLYE
jgi:hypothetical protein